jgi:hypothetical protein
VPEGDAKSKLKVGSPIIAILEAPVNCARQRPGQGLKDGRRRRKGTSASAISIALDDELCTMALVLGFDFGNGAEAQGRLWAGPCGSPSGHIPAGRQVFQSFGL